MPETRLPNLKETVMPKSVVDKILAIDTKIAALIDQRDALISRGEEVAPASLVPGASVVFAYGRGETRRELSGIITGVKPADQDNPKSSTLIRVAVGEGFDAKILTVYHSNVKNITPPATE